MAVCFCFFSPAIVHKAFWSCCLLRHSAEVSPRLHNSAVINVSSLGFSAAIAVIPGKDFEIWCSKGDVGWIPVLLVRSVCRCEPLLTVFGLICLCPVGRMYNQNSFAIFTAVTRNRGCRQGIRFSYHLFPFCRIAVSSFALISCAFSQFVQVTLHQIFHIIEIIILCISWDSIHLLLMCLTSN